MYYGKSTKKDLIIPMWLKHCDLCLSEKVSIIFADPDTLLNKRTKLIFKCRHKNKFLLPSLKN